MINLNRCCYLLLIFAAVGSIFTAWPFATWLLLVNALTDDADTAAALDDVVQAVLGDG